MKGFVSRVSSFFGDTGEKEEREVCIETNKHARLRPHRQCRDSQFLLLQELPLHHVQLFKFQCLMVNRRDLEKFLCLY